MDLVDKGAAAGKRMECFETKMRVLNVPTVMRLSCDAALSFGKGFPASAFETGFYHGG